MARIVSISFSSVDIRVVIATCRHGTVLVERAFRMSDKEFDDFLSLDSSEEYIVSVDSEELFQDIIYIPPADEKFIDNLIRVEIRRLHPGLVDYSFFYEIIENTLYEGKMFKKAACFIYANNDLVPVISRFSRYRKRIKQLYSSSYSLSRFVSSSSLSTTDPLLCIEGSRERKSVFLLVNSKLYFVRHIQSDSKGIDEMDVQNINMTIDYCFQTLRVKPRYAVFLGSKEEAQRHAADIALPIQEEILCRAVTAEPDTLREYAAPIASFLCLDTPKNGNILPDGYKEQSRAIDILRSGARILAVLCLLVFAGAALKAYSLAEIQQIILQQRALLNGIDRSMEEFARVRGEFVTVTPQIDSINRAASQLQQQKALLALDGLSSPGTHPTSVIMRQKDGNGVTLEIKGELKGASYAEMQAGFERLIANIKATGKLEIVIRKMDPVARVFNLELLYKGHVNGPV